jgi:hypothetical protein
MELVSIDTFSGLGGNAYAFNDFSRASMYCEIDKEAVHILTSVMQKKLVAIAPIHNDITTILDTELYKGIIASTKPEQLFVTGSWPCQGNSQMGKRKGMDDARSGLIREFCALVLAAKPAIMFCENVPLVVNNGSLRYVVNELSAEYDVAWDIFSAGEMGFCHQRDRFMCMCVHKQYGRAALKQAVDIVDASTDVLIKPAATLEDMPVRFVAFRHPNAKDRMAALGNAVVPQCSRFAFQTLGHLLLKRDSWVLKSMPKRMPSGGLVVNADGTLLVHTAKRAKVDPIIFDIVFDPAKFTPSDTVAKSPFLKEGNILTKPQLASRFATPRKGSIGYCNYLTTRSVRDLPTQLRFEVNTPGDTLDGVMNVQFVEALMGYPLDYTK